MKKLSLSVFFILFLSISISCFANSSDYSDEFNDAYGFAHDNKITTIDNIDNANMYWWLNRIAMAKMLSQYAINVLWKEPDTSKVANFKDVSPELDAQYNHWVTLAFQLWIMWIWIDNFRPYDTVTRAEFGTALSRVLYWDKYNQEWEKYYEKHLNALKVVWIMTKIDNPRQGEVRWYVMIMLMRSHW